mgnify:FL=1|jgi:hypothetical protein
MGYPLGYAVLILGVFPVCLFLPGGRVCTRAPCPMPVVKVDLLINPFLYTASRDVDLLIDLEAGLISPHGLG